MSRLLSGVGTDLNGWGLGLVQVPLPPAPPEGSKLVGEMFARTAIQVGENAFAVPRYAISISVMKITLHTACPVPTNYLLMMEHFFTFKKQCL